VPISTAVAPASMNSTTSVALEIPPMPITGIFHRVGGVIHHANGDGLDGRAGESGGDVGDARLAGFRIDGHGQEGVDE
jgi:hypothetical protein